MADPYEDLQPYLMEDNFDEKYADELEMLREFDDLDVPPPSHRSCRGRQYSPPPPPNWDEEAFSEAELKEDLPPARSTQPTDATTKGEPVVLCTTEFRLRWDVGLLGSRRMSRRHACIMVCCLYVIEAFLPLGAGEEVGQPGGQVQCHSPGGMETNLQDTSGQLFRDPGDEGDPSAAAVHESIVENGYSESVGIEWTPGEGLGQLGAYDQSSATVGGSHPLLFRGRVYRRIPPGLHISVTSSDGARVYLKMRPGGDCSKPAQPKVLVTMSYCSFT